MKKVFLILLNVSLLFALSCSDNDDTELGKKIPETPASELTIKLNKTSLEIGIGERAVLTPVFDDAEAKELAYKWNAGNDDISILSQKEDLSISLIGMKEGETIVTIESSDKRVSASCTVQVVKKPIKILAIGNSFSEDAVQSYLYDIAKAEGIEVIIGNMYIAGCTLDTHWSNIVADNGAYSYRKIGTDGNMATTANKSISAVLSDENWDYISLQQASPQSGIYSTYERDLPLLVNYLREVAEVKATLILHQTWAYAKTSDHSGFSNYSRDQIVMYNSIVDAVWKAADLVDINLIIPAGTAIQNGRTSYIGDKFCRDGYHLEVTYGRYTAACTWFNKIFNRSVVGNEFAPAIISTYNRKIAQNAAHYAVLKPREVTDMIDFKNEEEETVNNEILQNPIFIDFGTITTVSPWNNIVSVSSTGRIELFDKEGNATGIYIQVSDAFGGVNQNGESVTSTTWNMPESVSKDSFWGNTGATFEGKNETTGGFTVSSLNKGMKYNFTFFSTRAGVSDKRETQFTVTGGTDSNTVYIEPSLNKNNTVGVNSVDPDKDGRVTISVTSGPNNNNVNGFFYINAMMITPTQ